MLISYLKEKNQTVDIYYMTLVDGWISRWTHLIQNTKRRQKEGRKKERKEGRKTERRRKLLYDVIDISFTLFMKLHGVMVVVVVVFVTAAVLAYDLLWLWI